MSVKIYDGNIVYFEDWLKVEGYGSSAELKEKLVVEGNSEEAINYEVDRLYDVFCEWADLEGLQPMYF